jgi:hypothetical protein
LDNRSVDFLAGHMSIAVGLAVFSRVRFKRYFALTVH